MTNTRFSILLAFLMLLSGHSAGQVMSDEWTRPEICSVGTEKPRSYFMSYQTREEAVANNFEASPFYIGLNGTWKFSFFEDGREVPKEICQINVSTRKWDNIKVPGNWELQGYSYPIYTNIQYDFCPSNPTPPLLPTINPVGVYRTTFEIPALILDRDIYLHIGGAKSGVYVYINGEKVGYFEDSKSAAEFKINPYISDGTNSIALVMHRWSTGSWLECQDFWRVSGIERDCYIYSQPKVHIEDFKAVATLDSTYTDGIFRLEMYLTNNFIKKSEPLQVWYEILDEDGLIIDYSYKEMTIDGYTKDTVRFKQRMYRKAKQWSAENPYLYTLIMRIKEGAKFSDNISCKIGFRTTEIKGNQYYVNGKRVYIKGVNYHETHPVTGHYLDTNTIKKDMELMKQNNINAIRCSHYPQQRMFYELANRYGFYICNEANIESHGMGYNLAKTLGNNPVWLKAHMYRTENLYEQTKNFPCVMFWSLGNEGGNGYNFYNTYRYLKVRDSLRPVQYERAILEWNTDIFCPQYPDAGLLRKWGNSDTDRPYIMSEYAHAMGNSTGNFRDLWEEIYKHQNLQGGFIWDWVDQGFSQKDANDTEYFTYGGDYHDGAPSDANFLCNGLVNPDRKPHPGLSEVKKAYQYIHFIAKDLKTGSITVKNLYDFTGTSDFSFTYSLSVNGVKTKTGSLSIKNIAPGKSRDIKIPVGTIQKGSDVYLKVAASLKESKGVLKKGTVVASEQFCLNRRGVKAFSAAKGSVKHSSNSTSLIVSGSNFSVVFDKSTGLIKSYKTGKAELMADGFKITPSFWRAPTDNDYGAGIPYELRQWKNIPFTARNFNCTSSSGKVIVSSDYSLPEGCSLKMTYTIFGNGRVHVNYTFTGNASSKLDLFRHGVRMRIPKAYSAIEYFGRGPLENYCDRQWGNDVGIYRNSVAKEAFQYVRPQETGHHTDCRWLKVYKPKGGGVLFQADDMIEFSALNSSMEDFDAESSTRPYQWNNFSSKEDHSKEAGYLRLKKQTHINDVVARDYTEVSIDGRMMGVGADNSWGAKPYRKYRIPASESFSFGFSIIPYQTSIQPL